MTMTKREKILLQILLGVLVVGLLVIYLLLPKLKEKKTLLITKADDEATLDEMNESLQQINIYDSLASSEKRIEKINLFFNGIWNSYTVDGFINKLVADNQLEIKSLTIDDFQYVSDEIFGVNVLFAEVEEDDDEDDEEYDEDEDEYGTNTDEGDLLLSCDVSITVFGKYDDVLALMDQLNKESEAIAITETNFSKEYDYIGNNDHNDIYGNCSITFKIYGIKPYEKEVVADDK